MPLEHLLSAQAVRQRCGLIGQAALQGRTRHFSFDPDRMPHCVGLVAQECLQNYPDLVVPYHSRWRHFTVAGQDLWKHYADKHLPHHDDLARTRSAIDLVFVSVILDAGAGDQWRYVDPVTNTRLVRSEGLAAASIDLFFNRLARADVAEGVVVDADAILAFDKGSLETAFQHDNANSLLGVDGRFQLLQGLGNTLKSLSEKGVDRPGNIVDLLLAAYPDKQIEAGEILKTVLSLFNSMWPSGVTIDGVSLGDCGHHALADDGSSALDLVPFHKLSQWLSYSLIEPLQWAGFNITDLDQLTGLPEYRNGGLFIDTGVLMPIDPALPSMSLKVESEAVVEWRALTVWLLDKVAAEVRTKLGKTPQQLPLASVLQGGTWSAGRKLAAKKRGGLPPLNLDIQGTVF